MTATGALNKPIRYSILLVLVLMSGVWAEEIEEKPELLTPVQQRMQQEISLDFKDTPIDDVLMIMAKQADVDIIKSPVVEGTVTATLTDVPLAEALTNILESHGYAFITTENIVRVVPKDDIQQVREKIISRVFRVTYADVDDVEDALRKFISDQGAISSNPGTSNIIVTDVESRVQAINQFIEEIDRVTPQILVEAKIYDVKSTDSLDLGIKWAAQTATNFGTAATSETWGNDYGTLGNLVGGKTDTAFGSEFSTSISKATSTDSLIRFGLLNESIQLDAALHAEQEDTRAKLLANPRVLVLDNQQAEIKIVDEIPYQELSESSSGGSIGTTQFRDVGIELRVTPHLTRDGMIRLAINPKFSVRTGDTVLPGVTNSSPQPIVATRETSTVALIKDKQTVVIGGLKKQDQSQQISKVPLLGDLPLLGALFKFEGESTINSELVVFITPHLIKEHILSEDEERYLADSVYVPPNLPETKLGN